MKPYVEGVMMQNAIITMISLCFLFGCAGRYHHRVVNIGEQILYDVKLECNNRELSYGSLSPGSHSGYSGSYFKINKGNKVTIIWGVNKNGECQNEIYTDKYFDLLKEYPSLKEEFSKYPILEKQIDEYETPKKVIEKCRYQKDVYINRRPFLREVTFKMDGKDVAVSYERLL